MTNIERIAKQVLAATQQRYSLNELKSLLSGAEKMAEFDSKKIESILEKSGYLENKIKDAKFVDFYISGNKIYANFKTKFFDDNSGKIDDGNAYISWDGKKYEGDY